MILKEAAETGDVAALAAHQKAGADLGATLDENGWTTAHFAADKGHAEALKFLHEVGVNLTATTNEWKAKTPARLAALGGHVKALEALRQVGVFENFDAKLSSGNWTAAHYAAMSGQAAELEFLQEAGADLQASNWQGCTPLHLAAYFGKVEALRVLIEAGVNRNPLDEAGNTPTDDAARKGHLEAFKLLLQAGETREAEILPWLQDNEARCAEECSRLGKEGNERSAGILCPWRWERQNASGRVKKGL